MDIRSDDLSGPEIHALLQEHLRNMAELSPPESIHALDLDGLRRADVSFWTLWQQGQLLGCGALREIDPAHGEIKSMRTADAHRRKGAAARMLQHLLDEARRRLDALRLAFCAIDFEVAPGDARRFSFSGGLAAFPECRSENALFLRADAMLYTAKETGRNRICPE